MNEIQVKMINNSHIFSKITFNDDDMWGNGLIPRVCLNLKLYFMNTVIKEMEHLLYLYIFFLLCLFA